MLNNKGGGSRSSSSLFLAACGPVVPEGLCGRWNFVQSSLICISAPSSFNVTEHKNKLDFRWCLAGTAMFLKRNPQLWTSGWAAVCKERSSYAVACFCCLSSFLGPFQHNSSCLDCATSLRDVRKWLAASHGGGCTWCWMKIQPLQWWRVQSFSHIPQQHLWTALGAPVSPSLQQPALVRVCVTSSGLLHAVNWQSNHTEAK